jgi:hypothetical protein
MENKVNAAIDAATQAKVEAAINGIAADLPFLIELSATESKRLIYMEAGRVDFVRRAFVLAQSNPKLQPQFFEMVNYENDLSLAQSLDALIGQMERLLKRMHDTRNQAGSEAFLAALEVYSATKRGSSRGIEGAKTAYDELKDMFDRKGGSGKPNKPIES